MIGKTPGDVKPRIEFPSDQWLPSLRLKYAHGKSDVGGQIEFRGFRAGLPGQEQAVKSGKI